MYSLIYLPSSCTIIAHNREFEQPLKPGDVNKGLLTELQAKSDDLSAAMRGYIEWLIPQSDTLPEMLKEMFHRYRNKAQNGKGHARMPETVAWLQIGYEMFLGYAVSVGKITEASSAIYKSKAFDTFKKLAEEQSIRIENDKPTVKFINALKELIATGACKYKCDRCGGLSCHIC